MKNIEYNKIYLFIFYILKFDIFQYFISRPNIFRGNWELGTGNIQIRDGICCSQCSADTIRNFLTDTFDFSNQPRNNTSQMDPLNHAMHFP